MNRVNLTIKLGFSGYSLYNNIYISDCDHWTNGKLECCSAHSERRSLGHGERVGGRETNGVLSPITLARGRIWRRRVWSRGIDVTEVQGGRKYMCSKLEMCKCVKWLPKNCNGLPEMFTCVAFMCHRLIERNSKYFDIIFTQTILLKSYILISLFFIICFFFSPGPTSIFPKTFTPLPWLQAFWWTFFSPSHRGHHRL